MKKFNFAKIALLIFVCVMLFATLAVGAYADEAAETTSVNDVFQFGEYSINENGEASFSFTLNHEAKEALGENVEIGIVIVALDKLNGQSPIGADGKPATLESGKVYVKSLKGYNNTEYSFTLSNFNGELATRKYVVAPYLFDGTTVYYYEGDKVTETVEGISYEEILEISGHEHSYVAGEADENGNVTYACVCGEYYVVNNAAVNGEYYMGTDKVVFADGKLTAMGGEFTYTYNVTTGMINTDAGIFFQVIDGVIYFRGATPLHQHTGEGYVAEKQADGSINYVCNLCGTVMYTVNNAAVNGEYYMGTDKVVFADGKLTAMGGEFTYTYNVTSGMINTDAGIFFQVIDGVIYFRGATPLHQHTGEGYVAEEQADGSINYVCNLCGTVMYTVNNAAVNGEYYMGTDKVVFADGKLSAMGGEFTYTYNVTTGMIDTDAGIFFQVIDGVIYFRGATPLHQHNEATLSTEKTDATCTEAGVIVTICQFCGPINEEEIPALDHTYVDGYCECGAVDPDYYFEMTIADALVAEDGTKVQVSGTVVKIDYKWSSTNNNMSVTIKDANGDELYIYKLATEVALHDVITVKGIKTTYNGTNGTKIEIDAGATATIDSKEACDFSVEATCEKGVSCSLCGAVQEGSEPLPHNFSEATCQKLATCEVCGATTGNFADHVYGDDSVCDNCDFDKKAPIIFEFGENKEVTEDKEDHADGSAWAETDSFTVGGYIFTLDTFANVYKKAYDEMGNSAIKLGTSSKSGNFSFTVPEEIGKVIIKVAGYKARTAEVTVNGVKYAIETQSNNGDYTAIEIDTTNEKTVTFAVTSNYRVMIDSIAFVLACKHESTTVVTNDATCTEAGSTTTTCNDCEYKLEEEIPALGHSYGEDGICTRCGHSQAHVHNFVATEVVAPTCTEKGYTIYTCDCGEDSYNDNYVDALGHNYVDGICSVCEAVDPDYYFEMTIPEALAAAEGTKVLLSGTVCEIYGAWDEGYGNMSAYIVDENGNRILVFRTATKMDIGDKISVEGVIGVYNEVNQIAQGSKATITEEHVCSEYTDATCTELAACVVCGAVKEDSVLADHNYVDGECTVCHAKEGVTTITASKTIADLIKEYGWTSNTTKQSFNLDDIVSVKINGGSNTGKAYNGDQIRIYATDSPAGTLTISVAEGYELVSVKITTKTGTYAFLYVDGTTEDICNKSVNVSGSSVLLKSVKNGSDGKQVQITAIEVVYAASKICAHENTTVKTTDATCAEDGKKETICSDCGFVVTSEKIEALGHTEETAVTAPTCTAAGFTTYTCSVCGNKREVAGEAALGHTTDNGTCERCNEVIGGTQEPVENSVSKSHTEIATIAGVTAGQTTGVINGKEIALNEDITIVCEKGKAGTAPTIYSESIRLYQNGAILRVKAAEGCEMTTITIHLANKSDGKGPISVVGGTASALSNNTYTITVEAGVSEVVITTTGTSSSKRLYVDQITVDYKK